MSIQVRNNTKRLLNRMFFGALLLNLILYGFLGSSVLTSAEPSSSHQYIQTIGHNYDVIRCPTFVAINASGYIYVVDSATNIVYVLDSNGETINKWGCGYFYDGGSSINGIAINGFGQIFLATFLGIYIFSCTGFFLDLWDIEGVTGLTINQTGFLYTTCYNEVRVYNPSGVLCNAWGAYGAQLGNFSEARGIASNSTGDIYVADSGNHRIQVFNQVGQFLYSWGTSGAGAGEFNRPRDITVNASGNVYVADLYNYRIQVFTQTGGFLYAWGTQGSGPGEFNEIAAIHVDNLGQILVTDPQNYRLQVFTTTGGFIFQKGTAGHVMGEFNNLGDMAINSTGFLYVLDLDNNRSQIFSPEGNLVSTWDFNFWTTYTNYFWKMGINENGQVFLANLINITTLSPTGQFLTCWNVCGGSNEHFYLITGIAINRQGQVYCVEYMKNTVTKLSPSGEYLLKWEGDLPILVKLDDEGRVYVLTGLGTVEVYSPDGDFLNAWYTRNRNPNFLLDDIAVDGSGHVYVTDFVNDLVYDYSLSGDFLGSWGGTGNAAGKFLGPTSLAVNASGYVFVAERNGNRIQVFHVTTTADNNPLLIWILCGIVLFSAGMITIVSYMYLRKKGKKVKIKKEKSSMEEIIVEF